MLSNHKNKKIFIFLCLAVIACGVVVYSKHPFIYSRIEYINTKSVSKNDIKSDVHKDNLTKELSGESIPLESVAQAPVTHIKTPEYVKALYVSSWTASSDKLMSRLIAIADETEVNAFVIDIKDSTGRISFRVTDPELQAFKSFDNRIRDIRALTNLLHSKNIYIIGRISVFQDPYMANAKPEWAVTKKSDGKVWKDKKGLSFLDPANKDVHNYVIAIAKDAYAQGFDEINFDYVRYPSDGDISNINYHLTEGKTRSDNLETFFKYLSQELKKDTNIPISADLFGLTTEVHNDMGIGQVWEKALPYFDFLGPMVYPSHYPSGHNGFKNPANYPYEIIDSSIKGAISKTNKVPNQSISKIRPWIQDFNLGATYTKEMVQAQMKAVYDNKLNSWMIWDPKNKYTVSALELEKRQ